MRLRFTFKPMQFVKALSATLAMSTMCLGPVAQGAEAANTQKQAITDFIKETGLSKSQTVGEYWQGVRDIYPLALRLQLDHWVALNRNEMMPSVTASSFKNADGKEEIRVSLSKGGEVSTLTFADNKFQVNGVTFTNKEITGYKDFNDMARKVADNDVLTKKELAKGALPALGKNFVLTYKEFKRLTARQKAEYFVQLRKTMEAAQAVYTAMYGQTAMNEYNQSHQWAYRLFFGDEAFAANSLVGQPCIVAGYMSIYGENLSCGGNVSGAKDLAAQMAANSASCSGNAVACNPMVYGFDSGGGAYCVPRSDIKYATQVCNGKSPLASDSDPVKAGQDKKRIIESYLKKVKGQDINLVLDKDGKISADQYKQISGYLGDLQNFINTAVKHCDDTPNKRQDQQSACDNIKVRAISLQQFSAAPAPAVAVAPPPPPVKPAKDCDAWMSGSVSDGKGGCVCPDGEKAVSADGSGGGGGHHHQSDAAPASDASGTGAALPPPPTAGSDDGGSSGKVCADRNKAVVAAAKVTPAPQCDFWCRNKGWLLALGVGIVGLGFGLWWLHKRNTSSTTTTTTASVPVLPIVTYPTTTSSVTTVTTAGGTTTGTTSGGTTTSTTTTTEGGSGEPTTTSGGVSR